MKTSHILNKAADLLEIPGVWIQGSLSKNHLGEVCEKDSTDACRFCMAGAIFHICHKNKEIKSGAFSAARTVVSAYLIATGKGEGIAIFNDTKGRTVEEVVKTLREAAKEQNV